MEAKSRGPGLAGRAPTRRCRSLSCPPYGFVVAVPVTTVVPVAPGALAALFAVPRPGAAGAVVPAEAFPASYRLLQLRMVRVSALSLCIHSLSPDGSYAEPRRSGDSCRQIARLVRLGSRVAPGADRVVGALGHRSPVQEERKGGRREGAATEPSSPSPFNPLPGSAKRGPACWPGPACSPWDRYFSLLRFPPVSPSSQS